MAKPSYAELPEPLSQQLPELFASYPKLDKSTPSSWFAWTKDNKVKSHILEICHVAMLYDGVGWDELITAVPKTDELSLEYLRMLIRGPFRSMSDLIKLDRVVDNYYLHCLSLSKWPANVLMNFCIASRVPIEFEFLLSPWASRCEAGFEPTLAFLLSYSYGFDNYTQAQFKHRAFNMARGNHMWVDPASNWDNILRGLTPNASQPFKTAPWQARPTNCIWGISHDFQKLVRMKDPEIAEFYQLPIKRLEPVKQPKKVYVKKQAYADEINAAMFHANQINHIGGVYIEPPPGMVPAMPAMHFVQINNEGAWGLAPDEPIPMPAQPQPEPFIDEPEEFAPDHWDYHND